MMLPASAACPRCTVPQPRAYSDVHSCGHVKQGGLPRGRRDKGGRTCMVGSAGTAIEGLEFDLRGSSSVWRWSSSLTRWECSDWVGAAGRRVGYSSLASRRRTGRSWSVYTHFKCRSSKNLRVGESPPTLPSSEAPASEGGWKPSWPVCPTGLVSTSGIKTTRI